MLAHSAFFVAALLVVAGPAGAQRHARLIGRIDSLTGDMLRRSPAPGLSLAVTRGKETILARGYGYARLADSVRATERTVYPIASITKQFTAVAILRLAETKRLKLTDPIARYLPAFPEGPKPVTIKQLLGHISGLAPAPLLDGPDVPEQAPDQRRVVDYLRTTPPAFLPGEHFAYSNSGYYLLGAIIEVASGQAYGDYLRDALLGPANLTSTGECAVGNPASATGYDAHDGTLLPNPTPLPVPGFAAGGLCSTVLDLVAWERAVGQRKAINNLSWHQMIERVELNDQSRASYGYGVNVGRLEKHAFIGHGGATPGFASQLTYFPDDDVIIAVLANSGDALARRLADEVALLVLGVPKPSVKDVALTAPRASLYEGDFVLQGDSTPMEVRFRMGKLEATLGKGAAIRLLYQGSHEFAAESDPSTRLFFRVRSGRARVVEFQTHDLSLLAHLVSGIGK